MRRRARLNSSRSIPGKETPLVTAAVSSALLATLLAVNWVLIVVTTVVGGVLTVGGSVVAVTVIGGGVVAGTGIGGVVVSASVVVVTPVVVAAITADSEVNSIIDGSTLGNRYDHTLMVRSGSDRGQPVCTSREAIGNIGSELAIRSNSIETLEESKNTWVCRLSRVEGRDRFDDYMVVPNNLPGVVQLLRCGEVGSGGIGEISCLHPLRIQDNGECSVGVYVTTVRRELEFTGRHVVDTRNITHRGRVARATLNLLAVREGLAGTEIDEVIWADKGDRFTCSRSSTVDLLNDRWVQSKGGLGVVIAAILVVVAPILIIGRVSSAVVATILVIGRISRAVIATVLVVVAAVPVVLVVVATFYTVAAAKPVVLAGHKTVGPWNEEGAGELGYDEENEGKPDALHDSSQTKRRENRISESGRKDGVGSKQASLSKR